MDSTTTPTYTPGRAGAAIVALAPVVMLIAFVSHPFLMVLPDAEGVAAAVEAGTTRWAVVHLLTAVGSALLALAFLAIRAHLRDAGEDRWSRWGLPFVVASSVLYAVLPGLEFAPLTAAETGGDVVAVQAALEPWFVPVFVAGVVTFAIGVFAFVRGIAHSGVLGRRATHVVITALAVMAVSRAVPLGVAQFHLQGVAGVVALWPLARAMWRPATAATAALQRPSPAT
jgi:hypothetical protein